MDEATKKYKEAVKKKEDAKLRKLALKGQNVGYASFFCAVGFQLWLHLDSLDGKLARQNRPKKFSPFGEILDHGGDSMTWLFVLPAIGCMIRLDTNPMLFVAFVLTGTTMNYMAEPWLIYITGIMKFQSVDFIEISIIMSLIGLISGFFGTEIWRIVILQRFNLQLRHLIFWIQILLIPDLVIGKIPILLAAKKEKGWPLFDVLSPIIPVAVTLICVSGSYYFSTAEFLQRNLILFTMFFGIAIVKFHLRFVVTHMINSKFKPYDRCLIFQVLFTFGVFLISTTEMETKMLYGFLLGAVLDFAVYSFQLFSQLYREFDERIFFLEAAAGDARVQSNGNMKN